MKKVLIIHGYQGTPNGGWRPWLMGELAKRYVYACSLPMREPEHPIRSEWVDEIVRQTDRNVSDEVYLVGHSLGATAILRYLEDDRARNIAGAVLVSGAIKGNENSGAIDSFFEGWYDFGKIMSKCARFDVIHGDNDARVPLSDAETVARELNGKLVVIENGGHLNAESGYLTLPQCLEALEDMMNEG
ncbi:MAG TPA: alpha/beta fold hydrolase [Candidatus Fimivivens sp.]|nr:alpha/beta fold hydrolase [Candidatus Fimivivens sp.]